MTMTTNEHPMPFSPLPWQIRGCEEHPTALVASRLNCVKLRDANAQRIDRQDDWDFAVWACNNAPSLAAENARLRAALEATVAALEVIERDDGLCHVDTGVLADARAALEAK